ncbi:hypothetical protein [Williamsia sterculiae]|uniref:Uncharacterized protein n=1 Tax=Williamsia sterculiae TaxID=1344003 RepID=A0A1N7H9B0_9NOCA|nr:hypothetical protein [Williamsia sterculiae]SIS21465.1 hypothetical protein SAMN05445060_3756 [Williamsia sterculiae]
MRTTSATLGCGRIAVGVVVPVVAVAAHGTADGHFPGSAGLVLCALVGAVAAACAGRMVTAPRLFALLSGGQVACHLMLSACMAGGPGSMSDDPAAMPSGHVHAGSMVDARAAAAAAGTTWAMLLTHLIAIPVCAVLIAAVCRVVAVITAIARSLRRAPVATVVPRPRRVVVHVPFAATDALLCGGPGRRGPPVCV